MNDSVNSFRKEMVIVGRFPPPIDGQTVATERLASLIGDEFAVARVDVSAPEKHVAFGVRFRPERVMHYIRVWRRIRLAIADRGPVPVLWTSISPSVLGHLRDQLTTLRALGPSARVLAVIHHGNFDDLFSRSLTRGIARKMVERVDGFVFLSNALAEKCARWVPEEKRIIVPNTILQERVSTRDEIEKKLTSRADDSTMRILFVGNMIPSKGYEDLIRALPLIQEDGISIEARFAGRWPSEDSQRNFESLLQSLRIARVVQHEGAVRSDSAMKVLYQWADVMVLPTYYPTEAQPLVLIEAMANGSPVITTRTGSIPEMVDEGVEGRFVQPRDHAAIASAIISLAERSQWQRYSAAAYERFLRDFSATAVRERWLAALTST